MTFPEVRWPSKSFIGPKPRSTEGSIVWAREARDPATAEAAELRNTRLIQIKV